LVELTPRTLHTLVTKITFHAVNRKTEVTPAAFQDDEPCHLARDFALISSMYAALSAALVFQRRAVIAAKATDR
jgi:hypothetical protein